MRSDSVLEHSSSVLQDSIEGDVSPCKGGARPKKCFQIGSKENVAKIIKILKMFGLRSKNLRGWRQWVPVAELFFEAKPICKRNSAGRFQLGDNSSMHEGVLQQLFERISGQNLSYCNGERNC